MSALKLALSLNASDTLVTWLVSQSGILPYSLEEHNPSTGFVLKHVEIADAKLLSVIVVTPYAALNDPTVRINT